MAARRNQDATKIVGYNRLSIAVYDACNFDTFATPSMIFVSAWTVQP
jgi:hypothetical protein